MKKTLYLSLILSLSLISCRKTPVAQFSADTVEPVVGQEVYFTNQSENAVNYEWDFGDGTVSNEANPVHVFTGTGTYNVTLTAISKSGVSDKATLTITIMVPTLLVIEVREYYQQYTVAGASVFLYPDLASWDSQKNDVAEGFTNADGVVVFSDLEQQQYFVDVWEKDHNNYQLRNEDVGFITTDVILPHKITFFTAWVDYVGTGKGQSGKSLVITGLERKAGDKGQYPVSNQDWQKLYERSISVKK